MIAIAAVAASVVVLLVAAIAWTVVEVHRIEGKRMSDTLDRFLARTPFDLIPPSVSPLPEPTGLSDMDEQALAEARKRFEARVAAEAEEPA